MIRLSDIGSAIAESGTLDRPLDHLMACNRRIEERLETLVRAGEALEDRPAEALQAVHSAFRFLDSSGVLHTRDEEESVFPRLRAHLAAEEARYLARLESEHDDAEGVYAGLKGCVAELEELGITPERTAAYRAAAARMRSLYAGHIASEDSTLVSLGRASLDQCELAAIASEMKLRRGL